MFLQNDNSCSTKQVSTNWQTRVAQSTFRQNYESYSTNTPLQHKVPHNTSMKVNSPNDNRVKCISKHCTYDVLCLPTPAPSHKQPLKNQGHPNQARPSPVSKVLRGDVADGQLRQDHLCTALVNPVQLVIENLPFSIHNGLVLLQHTHHHTRLTGHPIQTFLPITVSKYSSSLHAGHLFLRFFIPGDILQISDYHPYMPWAQSALCFPEILLSIFTNMGVESSHPTPNPSDGWRPSCSRMC